MNHPLTSAPDRDAPPPVFHPSEEFLLDYAAGTASSGEQLMIATHLSFCEKCRRAVRAAQIVGGSLLDRLAPERLAPNMLNRTLVAIEAGQRKEVAEAPPLSAFLAHNIAQRDWKTLPGGFRMRRIRGHDEDGHVWLFDAPAGMKLLPHRHRGDEWTVILSGEFIDNRRSFRAGDFACLADGEEHRPMTGPGERCVSLIMVREDPLYTTLLGKLAALFVKL